MITNIFILIAVIIGFFLGMLTRITQNKTPREIKEINRSIIRKAKRVTGRDKSGPVGWTPEKTSEQKAEDKVHKDLF